MKKKVAFMDLRVEDKERRRDLLEAVDIVFRHGRLIMGPEVQQLESKIAEYCGRKYAVGVNSGTDALFLALKSAGVRPGDEVIVPALSWIATANAVVLTGGTPVFADIGDDLNIDPESVKTLITPQTKVIMPVHFTGKLCQMPMLTRIAEEHGLTVIEDAAQAFGAQYKGCRAGSFGKLGCFSMNPMKIFAACGEAGMIVTDQKDIHERLIMLRYNGMVDRTDCAECSLNGRLDTLQAAILLKRLEKVENNINKRRRNASLYDSMLDGVVNIPMEAEGEKDIYYTYTIRAERRNELKAFLEERGIETQIHHPYLMPEQIAYRDKIRGSFPNAKRLVKQVLCIPVNEKLTERDINYVAASIREFYKA